MIRLLVIALLGLAVAGFSFRYRRGVATDAARGGSLAGTEWPAVPAIHRSTDAPCTWLIFTTPWCASCEQVKAMLGDAFPHHEVRTIDATKEIALGEAYEVQRAPTTLLVDHHGAVLERLVGPEAVLAFVGTTATASLSG